MVLGHSRALSDLSRLDIKGLRVGCMFLNQKKFEFKLKFVGGDTATVPGLSEKLHVSSTNKQNYSISCITLQRQTLCSELLRCPLSCGGEISSSWAPSNGRADEYVVVVMSNDFSALSILDWIQEAHNHPYLISLLMA